MPVTMELREEGHVAYYLFSEPWTTHDLTKWYPKDTAYRNSVNFLVHTFMTVTEIKNIPIDIISARRNAPAFTNPHSGQLVMVGAKGLARRTAEMIFKLAHYERAKFFDTEDEAWAYLRSVIAKEAQIVHQV